MKGVINNITVCGELKVAESFFSRLIGLMFKEKMDGFDGLLIKKCNSIHTFFMRYPLDILFLDKEMKVVRVYRNLLPWRMTRVVWKAVQVLELKAGTLPSDIKIGDRLEVCTN